MPGSEKPVMIAVAARVSRLRSEAEAHRSGVACPYMTAFLDGAGAVRDDARGKSLRKLLDRYIYVAAVRERLGTARADTFTLADLERLARGPESAVLAAAREDIQIHAKGVDRNEQPPERLLTPTFPKPGRLMRPSSARRSRFDGS